MGNCVSLLFFLPQSICLFVKTSLLLYLVLNQIADSWAGTSYSWSNRKRHSETWLCAGIRDGRCDRTQSYADSEEIVSGFCREIFSMEEDKISVEIVLYSLLAFYVCVCLLPVGNGRGHFPRPTKVDGFPHKALCTSLWAWRR